MTDTRPYPVFEPSKSLSSRIARRLVKYRVRRMMTFKVEKPIVSFSFDDCPRSVMENALPLLEERHWHATIYAAMGLCGSTNHLGLHMSRKDMQKAHKNGHQIDDHTFSHVSAGSVSTQDFLTDIEKNQTVFSELGLPPARTFAYPYGEVTVEVKTALSRKFPLLRGIHAPNGAASLDLNQTASQRLYSGQDFAPCLEAIRQLKTKPSWLILFTHDVRENPSEFGCTPSDFKKAVKAVEESGAEVLPVAEALLRLQKKARRQGESS